MTDKTAALIKNLIAGYFALLGLAYVGCFLFLAIDSIGKIGSSYALMPVGAGLLVFPPVFALLAYGLYKSRPWIARLHMLILILWLASISPFTLWVMPGMFHQRDIGLLILIPVIYLIPISIQLFLSLSLKRLTTPPPALMPSQMIGLALGLVLSCVALFFVGGALTLAELIMFDAPGPRVWDRDENDKYVVVAQYHPSPFVTTVSSASVVCTNKRSWLGSESCVWSSGSGRLPDSLSVHFHGSDSVSVVRYRSAYRHGKWGPPSVLDTVLVDLSNPDSKPDSGSDGI